MKTELFSWQDGWDSETGMADAELIIYFSAPQIIRAHDVSSILRSRYPNARQIGCSSGGEIYGAEVLDGSISGVALSFEHAAFSIANAPLVETEEYKIGIKLGSELRCDDLKLVFILSDGLNVNGSELVRGLSQVLPEGVLLTGGLAGDGPDFGETYVGVDEQPKARQVLALGVSGSRLKCRSGNTGGWQVFGPPRQISRSKGSVLFELDGSPALDLYKKYLGSEADNFLSTALLYPIAIRAPGQRDQDIVRTVIDIDEINKSLIFAGDVPEGYSAQLMSASFGQLATGAEMSAEQAIVGMNNTKPLALLVSGIGRKLLMRQMIADEVEAVKDVLPVGANIVGLYAYGEIAPHEFTGNCQLHNQTMTITTLWEE
ncbi:Uncharacterised protein [Zhongshania aliphaticivorans]|uniref:Histidine kinase n=1 Tax=Zhongshania aliphaticivorans TaxID=1470434 RepID=A0A5S9PPL9_9GAMM|nr:FIST N-terminal domain-containing protein [Zhongshania aliphaticivorans]CAA0106442.1 Uncharacterised protein [Zhongshania aliphaticivorans]CAA0106583.1 Uncharacterised protein [Zhongshania aliphaticivorans]